MQCFECDSEMLEGSVDHEFRVSGVRVVGKLPARTCPKCGAQTVEANALRALELGAAAMLAKHGVRTGEVFRFMRKALGLRAKDLQELIETDVSTISRWERGHVETPRKEFALLAELVADAVDGRTAAMDLLKALANPPATRPSMLEIPTAACA